MTEVWSTTGAGSGMSASLQLLEHEYKLLFKQGQWNAIVRAGVYDAGVYFVRIDLPKRFTMYALELGYTGNNLHPLVDTGRLRSFLLAHAYPEARATSSNVSLLIRLPTPAMITHYRGGLSGLIRRPTWANETDYTYDANYQVHKVLSTITTAELAVMDQQMAETINGLIAGATHKTNRFGTETASLTVIQKSSIAHTVKAQGSIHNHITARN